MIPNFLSCCCCCWWCPSFDFKGGLFLNKKISVHHGQLGLSLAFPPSQFPVHSYEPYAIWCAGLKNDLYQAYVLRLILVSTLQQHGCVMCSAPTRHMTKVRPSIDSPHCGLVSHPAKHIRLRYFISTNWSTPTLCDVTHLPHLLFWHVARWHIMFCLGCTAWCDTKCSDSRHLRGKRPLRTYLLCSTPPFFFCQKKKIIATLELALTLKGLALMGNDAIELPR